MSKSPNKSLPLLNDPKIKTNSLLIKPISSPELTTNLFNASSFATHFMLSYLSNSGLGKSEYKNSTLTSKFKKIKTENKGYNEIKMIKGSIKKNYSKKINLPL
jgi:hypothetical protein